MKGPIKKSTGVTTSERYLGGLATRSFLSLWSYQNVFKSPGDEFCDLLVVCGEHVIVFSDKTVRWQNGAATDLAWSRWYKRAIQKSASQVNQAKRWLLRRPGELYLDSKATVAFPLELPPPDKMKFHGVVVALGAAEACRAYFNEGSGSLGLMPDAEQAGSGADGVPPPFFVGNPGGEHSYIHVLDDVSLDIVLRELDTVTDFTDYLSKKEEFIRSGKLMLAHGEEDLLALYISNVNEGGRHDFYPNSEPLSDAAMLVIEGGYYNNILSRPEYIAKKQADSISYVWDMIVEKFARNIIDDTSYEIEGLTDSGSAAQLDLGVRYLALAPRLERRVHGLAIKGAFERIGEADRFFRGMLPNSDHRFPDVGYFILLLKRGGVCADLSDHDYRAVRARMTYAYAMNLLRARPDLKRVVGIATEGEVNAPSGRSEDVVYAEQPTWTQELIEETERLRRGFDILKNGLADQTPVSQSEYPPSRGGDIPTHAKIDYLYLDSTVGFPSVKRSRNRARLLSGTSVLGYVSS